MVEHIRVKRMWKYVHMKVELTPDEEAHLSECRTCLNVFNICVRSESPSNLDSDDDLTQERSA